MAGGVETVIVVVREEGVPVRVGGVVHMIFLGIHTIEEGRRYGHY